MSAGAFDKYVTELSTDGIAKTEIGPNDMDDALHTAVVNLKRNPNDNVKLLRVLTATLMQTGASEPAPESLARLQGLMVALEKSIKKPNVETTISWVAAPSPVLRMVTCILHVVTRGAWLTGIAPKDAAIERQWLALASLAPSTVQALMVSMVVSGQPTDALNICERLAVRQTPTDPVSRALAAALSPRGVEDFVLAELLHCEPLGQKPMLGSAPAAVTLTGVKASEYTCLDRLPSWRAEHAHHGAMLAVLLENGRAWSEDVQTMVESYFDRVSSRILEFLQHTSAPLALFGALQAPGLSYLLAVAHETVVCHARCGNVTKKNAVLEALLTAARIRDLKAVTDAAPEYRSFDSMIPRVPAGSSGLPLLPPVHRVYFSLECAEPSLFATGAILQALDSPASQCLGLIAHITTALMRLQPRDLSACLRDVSSHLLCAAMVHPHISIPLLQHVVPVIVNCGGAWLADTFLRIIFAPLAVFASKTDVTTCAAGEADPVVDFVGELGSPTNTYRLADTCTALSQLPVEEAALRWGELLEGIGPMSTRMLAAARLIHPLMLVLGPAVTDPHCIPVSLMSLTIAAVRFLVTPASIRDATIDVVLSVAKRMITAAPLAVVEASVAPVVDLLRFPSEYLSGCDGMVNLCAWAMSTLCNALEVNTTKQPLPGATSALFDALHDLVWVVVARIAGDSVHVQNTDLFDVDAPLGDFRLSQPPHCVPLWPHNAPATTRLSTEGQLVHCCMTTMATLATIDPALVEKTLVCVANVWRATHRSIPTLAEACVTCIAVVGHGIQRPGLPNLQALLGGSIASSSS